MPALDRVKDFFIKNILIPKVFRIDIPGYVAGKFYTIEGQSVFVRNVFVPETFFIKLEHLVIKEMGAEGVIQLYRIGKQFGYRFSQTNRFPLDNPAKAIVLVASFFETLYADSIKSKVDIPNKILVLDTKGLVITRENGGGYILTIGGCAGIWGYLVGDYSVECSSRKIGNEEYELVSAAPSVLEKEHLDIVRCIEKPQKLNVTSYNLYNQPPLEISETAPTIDKLMTESGVISYKGGRLHLSVSNVRFIPIEISLLSEVSILPAKFVSKAAYDSFYEIGKNTTKQKDPYLFIAELLTAFGFGIVDVIVKKNSRVFNMRGYPYLTEAYKNTDFSFITSILRGFLDGNTLETHSAVGVSSKISGNMFILTIEIK
jgi:hypothetical protein